METVLVFGGIALAIVGYVLSKAYFDKVGARFSYDINGSKTRFIPLIGWGVVLALELSENSNIPLEIVAVVVATALYAVILYKKTNSILHSILVALINSVVSFAVAIFIFLKMALWLVNAAFGNNRDN